MSFELTITDNTPVTSCEDLQEAVMIFLTQIGYLSENYQPRTASATSKRESVPFVLFYDCFLSKIGKGWKVDELTKRLKTTPPTVYRHINKLLMIGLIDQTVDDVTGESNLYRVRFGNISAAWKVVEANIEAVKEIYRKSVDAIEENAKKDPAAKKAIDKSLVLKSRAGRLRDRFRITMADRPQSSSRNPDDALVHLLTSTGYLERTPHEHAKIRKSIPYRLFSDCFMKRRDRAWDADSLAAAVKTSKPTVYRHLNKLLSLGVLESVPMGTNYPMKIGYRIRYGDFSRAWYFVENRIENAVANYRKTVNTIHNMMASGGMNK